VPKQGQTLHKLCLSSCAAPEIVAAVLEVMHCTRVAHHHVTCVLHLTPSKSIVGEPSAQLDVMMICATVQAKTQLGYLFDLLDLLIKTTNHVIRAIWNLLHLHETDQGIHLGRQQQVQRVAIVTQGNSSTSSNFVDVNVLVKVHHVLALRVDLNQNLVFAHHLLSQVLMSG